MLILSTTIIKNDNRPDISLKQSPKVFRITDEGLIKLKEVLKTPAMVDKLSNMTAVDPQALASDITQHPLRSMFTS